MIRTHALILLCALCLLGCSDAKSSDAKLKRAPSMDLDRMQGDWTIAARIPTFLDRDASSMHAHFEVAKDKSMAVTWSFQKKPSEGSTEPPKESTWNVEITPGTGLATTIWRVTPIWPIHLKYYVIEFSGDYSWVILGSLDRKYLWVLSRGKDFSPALLDGLLTRIGTLQFDVHAVKRT